MDKILKINLRIGIEAVYQWPRYKIPVIQKKNYSYITYT